MLFSERWKMFCASIVFHSRSSFTSCFRHVLISFFLRSLLLLPRSFNFFVDSKNGENSFDRDLTILLFSSCANFNFSLSFASCTFRPILVSLCWHSLHISLQFSSQIKIYRCHSLSFLDFLHKQYILNWNIPSPWRHHGTWIIFCNFQIFVLVHLVVLKLVKLHKFAQTDMIIAHTARLVWRLQSFLLILDGLQK